VAFKGCRWCEWDRLRGVRQSSDPFILLHRLLDPSSANRPKSLFGPLSPSDRLPTPYARPSPLNCFQLLLHLSIFALRCHELLSEE
jgi:hypothetical protein